MKYFCRNYWHKVRLLFLALLVMLVMLAGCAGNQAKPGNAMATVATVAATAPGLAHQLDDVYAYLVSQKAVPDNLDKATLALQTLDKIAPVVQAGAEALSQPGQFSWVQAALQVALAVAQIMGYVAPLL